MSKRFTHTGIERVNHFLINGGAARFNLTAHDIAVLYALGSQLYRNEKAPSSTEYIQQYTSCSSRQVKLSIHKLYQLGIINITKKINKIGKHNEYSLDIPPCA